MEKPFTFADIFCGIGGFHIALSGLGGECVFAAEIDDAARRTYEANFRKESPALFDGGNFIRDITTVDVSNIPDFDVLCAGFPCQPFSQAGFKKGFKEARGTLFFDIARIIKAKKPKAFFLENVRHLMRHDDGKTIETIERIITQDLEYSFAYRIVKASDFGLPQHRPRLFMVGFSEHQDFSFPAPTGLKTTMSDILGGHCPKDIGYTLRVGGRGSGLGDRRNWDSYLVDGEEVRITSKEGLALQGFPESFILPVSEAQAMKQLGNSVAVPAIKAVAENMIGVLNGHC